MSYNVLVLRFTPVSCEVCRSFTMAFSSACSLTAKSLRSVTLLASAGLFWRCRKLASCFIFDWSFGLSSMVMGGNEVGKLSDPPATPPADLPTLPPVLSCPWAAERRRCNLGLELSGFSSPRSSAYAFFASSVKKEGMTSPVLCRARSRICTSARKHSEFCAIENASCEIRIWFWLWHNNSRFIWN